MSEKFSHSVCKHIVNEISGLTGFNGIKNSSSDILADVLRSFIVQMGESSAKLCAHSGRTEANFYDVAKCLQNEGGLDMKQLYQYYQTLATTTSTPTTAAAAPTAPTTTGDNSRELDLSLFDFTIPPYPKPVPSYLTTSALTEREHNMQSLFHTSLKAAAGLQQQQQQQQLQQQNRRLDGSTDGNVGSTVSPSSMTTTTTTTTTTEGATTTTTTTTSNGGAGGGVTTTSGVGGADVGVGGMADSSSSSAGAGGVSGEGAGGASKRGGDDRMSYDQFEQFLSENVYLPPLPPKHTFTFTPVYNKKQENSLTLQQVRTRHKRMVQTSLTRIHEADLSTRATNEPSDVTTNGITQPEQVSAMLYNMVADLADEQPPVLPPSDQDSRSAAAHSEKVVNPYLVIVKQKNAQLITGAGVAHGSDVHAKKAHEMQVFPVDNEEWGASEAQYVEVSSRKDKERVAEEAQESSKKKKKKKHSKEDQDLPSFSLKRPFVATDQQDIDELLPPNKRAKTVATPSTSDPNRK